MSWSPAMRERRRARGGQADWLDDPVLAYGLVCDGSRLLANEMVVTRKPHSCFTCARMTEPRERCRRDCFNDGKTIETRYVCAWCCDEIRNGGAPWRSA